MLPRTVNGTGHTGPVPLTVRGNADVPQLVRHEVDGAARDVRETLAHVDVHLKAVRSPNEAADARPLPPSKPRRRDPGTRPSTSLSIRILDSVSDLLRGVVNEYLDMKEKSCFEKHFKCF